MYLASIRHGSSVVYSLRQSRLDPQSNHYLAHEVYSLGPNPADHFELFDDAIPLFSLPLQEAVEKCGYGDPDPLLEELLRPFFPRQTQDRLDRFQRNHYDKPRPLDPDEKTEIRETVHLFDRRRLYYLYYGAIDQSRLYRMHEKLCRQLLAKCRDEREYLFRKLEAELPPSDYHNYIYAIFDLQRHFNHSLAAIFPEVLSHDEIGDRLCEDICSLNGSTAFLLGEESSGSLHPHLVRYLVMFFDFEPQRRSLENEFIRNFINSHRTFRWPEKNSVPNDEKTMAAFSRPYEELKAMDSRELTRLYRKKALELHPDQGGDQELFVEMTEIYQQLLSRKKQQ